MKKTIVLTLTVLTVVVIALATIPATRDEMHWRWASHKDEIASYREYVATYPQGKHVSEARDSIQSLPLENFVPQEQSIANFREKGRGGVLT